MPKVLRWIGRFTPIVLAILMLIVAIIITASGRQDANASVPTGSMNPWTYQMDNPDTTQQGLVVRCNGGSNGQCFQIYDYLNQPIFVCNKAGGCAVTGDNFGTFIGSDIFNVQTQMTITDPNPTEDCLRVGRMKVGGTSGNVWKCKTNALGQKRWTVIAS